MQTLQLFYTLVGINSLFLFITIVTPLFLGTTRIGLTHLLSKIGKVILASSSLLISSLTTSMSKGLSFLCCYLVSLTPSSSKKWCMHLEGLMLLMLAKVQPMACLWSLKIARSFSSWFGCNLFAIMTGNLSFSIWNTYFKWLGRLYDLLPDLQMACLWSLKIVRSFSYWFGCNLFAIMTSNLSFFYKGF